MKTLETAWSRFPTRKPSFSPFRASKLVKNSVLKVYPDAPHGLTSTHKDQVNADLLAFLGS